MRGSRAVSAVAGGAMEIAWSCAWANFLTRALFDRPFPLAEAGLSFAAAALLTALSAGRGWRIGAVLALQAAALAPAVRWMAHLFGRWGASLPPPFGADPIGDALATPEWLVFILVVFWGVLFWGGGVALARRGRDYTTLCRRFDLGLTAFLVLLIVDFALAAGGARAPDHAGLAFFPAFLLSGLLAVGAARDPGGEGAAYLPGYGGLGVILSFVAGVLLLGLGAIFFFLPFLGRAADVGYRGLKVAGRGTLSVLERVVLWLHGLLGHSAPVERALKAKKAAEAAASRHAPASPWLELVGRVLVWFFWVLLGAVLLVLVGALVYCTVQWLLSRSAGAEPRPIGPELLRLWRALRGGFRLAVARVRRRFCPCRSAAQIYQGLVGWGAWSGVPRRGTDTAREYGGRLEACFPGLAAEIAAIVEAFHQEVYAGRPAEDRSWPARAALRTLRKPSLWPTRLKARFSPLSE